MRKPYPIRQNDKWEHALTGPLRGLRFETIELMRADLFKYLDILTTDAYTCRCRECRAELDAKIQCVADRLKEMTPYRKRALGAAMKAGRVDYACNIFPDDQCVGPKCGPLSAKLWEELQQQWEESQEKARLEPQGTSRKMIDRQLHLS